MSGFTVNILHLYPDLLNLYGDKGNIECMRKRLLWRGIDVNVTSCTNKDDSIDFFNTDIIFVGGGSDREQEIVCTKLLNYKEELTAFVEEGKTLVAVCGGYQLLGKYYQAGDKKIEGLGILDISTEAAKGEKRLIGNIVLKSDIINAPVVGFENHGGRTEINGYTPLGKVVYGFGNNGKSGAEGVVYKNLIGTYLHGPLLPKNPELCDYILSNTLKHKYPDFKALTPLDDELENTANNYIVEVYSQK